MIEETAFEKQKRSFPLYELAQVVYNEQISFLISFDLYVSVISNKN